ncbi:MAG: hypothetical protein F4100_09645, partial [Rhodothermaceae bacterium]|nr:hypothetical protein [Rhodothermaceae bacterium]
MASFRSRHRGNFGAFFVPRGMQALVWFLVGLPTLAAGQEHVPSIQIRAADHFSQSGSVPETFEEEPAGVAFDVAVISESVLDSGPRFWTVDMGSVNLFRLPDPLIHSLNGISPDALIGPVWNHGMAGQPVETFGQENGGGQFWDLQGMARHAQSSIQVLEGNSRDYVISIGQQPSGDVTVDITGQANTDLTVTPSKVTFTANDWSDKPVTLAAADDADADNDDITLTLTIQGSSANPTQQSVTIVDDEIIWELVPKSILEGSATSSAISIYAPPLLDLGPPSGDVTFTVTGHTGTSLDPVPTTLTFPAGDWQNPQRLGLSTKVDPDDQDEQVTLTLTAAGGGYTGLTYSLDVTIDDRPPFEILIPEGRSVLFGLYIYSNFEHKIDAIGTYSGYQGTDLTVSPSSVTYRADSWVKGPWPVVRHDGQIDTYDYVSNFAEVEIRAGSDSDDEDDQEILIFETPFETGTTVQVQIHVRIEDDDDPGLVVSPSSLGIGEGQSESFTVQLSEAPLGAIGNNDVTVQIPRSRYDLSASPSSLTFTTSDWNTPQTVSLSAGQDNDSANDFVAFSVAASGGGFDGEQGIVDVTILDDDDPEIIVSPTEVSVQEGGKVSFRVKLATEPTEERVTVSIPSFKDPALSRSRWVLTFTGSRYGNYAWNQTVRVSAEEDNNTVNESETITLTASGGEYDGITADVRIVVTDNDVAVAALVIDPSSIEVDEGGTKTFDVSLAVQPTGKVTVSMSDFKDSEALSRSPSTLTFTSSDYSDVQTVTVTAHKDDDADSESETITLTASGGGYDNASPEKVTVHVTDNDVAGAALVIAPASVAVDEGGTSMFDVSLAAQPKGDVTVTIPALTEPDLSHDRPTLTFTASNYSTGQTVTVSAVEDANTVGESETITLTASGGGYDNAS